MTNNRQIAADIVFVGGGSAGLSGAVRARELGLETVVLEKMGSCGGDALLAAGFWLAAGSRFQQEQGIEDSPVALYRDWMAYSSYRCRGDLVRVLAQRSAPNVEWLERHGLRFTGEIQTHGTTAVPRVLQNEGMGAHYCQTFQKRAEDLGSTFLLKTKAGSLILEDGAVVGVMAESADGNRVEVRARGVVLASGGFGRHAEMVRDHLPVGRHTMVCAGWAQGDNVRLAQEAGAPVADMDVGLFYKCEMPGTAGLSMRTFFLLLCRDAPVVNLRGERFMDESIWNPFFSAALEQQPGGGGFVLFDEAMRTNNPFTDFESEVTAGKIAKAESFGTLASEIGVPDGALEATMAQYNADAAAGVDRQFGKPEALVTPLATPPYYAMEVVPLVLNTVGGPMIDASARVLAADRSPVPGLYAAGNGTAGFYASYPSTGAGLQISSIFGQIAAETVAAEA